MALFSQPKKQAFPRAVFLPFLAQNGHQNGFKSWENHVKNDTWNEVEKTSTKCVKSDAVRPVKNEFSIGRVVKNHENQRCEQLRKYVKKWGRNNTKITEKWALELNKKRCLKTYPKKAKNIQNWVQIWTPQNTLKHKKNKENRFQNLTKKSLQNRHQKINYRRQRTYLWGPGKTSHSEKSIAKH